MKYRLRRYESGTMCRMALAYTPELQIPIPRALYRGYLTGGYKGKRRLTMKISAAMMMKFIGIPMRMKSTKR